MLMAIGTTTHPITRSLTIVTGQQASRRRRVAEEDKLVDSAVEFQAYKCYDPDCIVPDFGTVGQPLDERPSPFDLWSGNATWPDNTLPADNQDVTIPFGRWIVVDTENLPLINNLYVYGSLEFEFAMNPGTSAYYNFLLSVKNIFISRTGRLVAG